MMMRFFPAIFLALIAIGFLLSSCKKESFITDPTAKIDVSADTLRFDTVFTTAGSTTQSLKIINSNSGKLLISSIKLMGGSNSPYRLNINGTPKNELADVELAAEDSMYIFVSVTISPDANNLPFIVKDSIEILCNGNKKYIQLEAFGQNAHFLRNHSITENTGWQNDLPYVIIGSFYIDTAISLTINSGCKIYLHADAPIIVDGSLIVNGTKNNEVRFAGDRLDEYYRDFPASWPGIYFRNKSIDNVMSFAVIKNAYQAIALQNPSENNRPKLTLHQCIIDNAFENGLLSINSSINADNTLISNCGNNISIQAGGKYNFTNCTVASYSNSFLLHKTPVLQANNYFIEDGTPIPSDLDANFTNCIFWGDGGIVDNETIFEKQGNSLFNVSLNHCIIKVKNEPTNVTLNNIINNQDPLFDNIDIGKKIYDFRITKDLSAPGIDKGTGTSFLKDLDDNSRISGAATDLGCYEKP